MIRAVLWDFGGVLTSSPFEAFATYERTNGLPDGFLRRLNATNPDTNAWARLERSEIDVPGFVAAYEQEAAAAGGVVSGAEVMALLTAGSLRPAMVDAVRRCRGQFKTALLTNNFLVEQPSSRLASVLELFDLVLESSKAGVRKPDRRFYEMACDRLGINPSEAVFLDDLGVNLKPARAMGMTTIKVIEPARALRELQEVLGLDLLERAAPGD